VLAIQSLIDIVLATWVANTRLPSRLEMTARAMMMMMMMMTRVMTMMRNCPASMGDDKGDDDDDDHKGDGTRAHFWLCQRKSP
jgi:hypothetical protein